MPRSPRSPSSASMNSKISSVVTEYFECDYEKDCTPLYKAIEQAIVKEDEDYDEIAHFLDTSKWKSKQGGKSTATAKTQAKTWVTRFTKDKNKKDAAPIVEWSQLPLHLAIVGGAPSGVIGSLVKLYPQALRCTDDQQMLPLHLALRHGADDEVVAYLLMQFPEAVNAQGKNGRTPVDCALRARDKLRGIVLETFVEKTKAHMKAIFSKEKKVYQSSLEAATNQMNSASEDLEAKIAALTLLNKEHHALIKEFDLFKVKKASTESVLAAQVVDLTTEHNEFVEAANQKIEKLTSDKLSQSVELQKKIDALTAEKRAAKETAHEVRKSGSQLSKELNTIQKLVADAVTTEDWINLKQEVYKMNSYRFSRDKSKTEEEFVSLKGELQATLEATKAAGTQDDSKKELKKEVKKMEKTTTQLAKTLSSAKTPEDLEALRSKVGTVRDHLREKTGAPKMMGEIAALRKTLEAELKRTEGKTKTQLVELTQAVARSDPAVLDSTPIPELTILKADLESLKLKLAEDALARNTEADIKELGRAMDATLKVADAKTKAELAPVKNAIDGLRTYIAAPKSNDDLVAVAKDVDTLKELLHKKQASANIQLEANMLKEAVAVELAKSEGKAQKKKLLKMEKSITTLAKEGVETKEVDELVKIKDELAAVKKGLKGVEEATKAQQNLEELKKKVEDELSAATQRTEKEISDMRVAVDAINLEQKEAMKLKASLSTEIKTANGQIETELHGMKKKVDAINVSELESQKRNKSDWEAIHQEMATLKAELQSTKESKMEEEMTNVKRALAQIKAEQTGNSDGKYEELRKEMSTLRKDIGSPRHSVSSPSMSASSPTKKGKFGFKKMFSRFGRSGGGSVASVSSKQTLEEPMTVAAPAPAVVSKAIPAPIDTTPQQAPASKEPISTPIVSPINALYNMFNEKEKEEEATVEEDASATFRPPSMCVIESNSTGENTDTADDTDDTASTDDETAPPAVQTVLSAEKEPIVESEELSVTLALHKTLSNLSVNTGAGGGSVDSAAVRAMPSFSPRGSPRSSPRGSPRKYLPSALRKVRSMEPWNQPEGKSVSIDPYEIVKTWSKVNVQESGEVELESVPEGRGEEAAVRM